MWGTVVDCLVKASLRTCGTTGFCYRNRAFADDMTSLGTDAHSPYTIIQDSILFSEGNSHLHADIENTNNKILFTLDVTILQDNTARVQINEKTPLHQRYDDHVQYTLDNPLRPVSPSQVQKGGEKTMIALDDTRALVIYSQPFKMEFLVDNVPVIIFNDRSFFNIEHLRTKTNHKPKMIKEPSSPDVIQDTTKLESTMWAERFINWTDPKPNGPESIGLDISFPGFSHVYGVPVSNPTVIEGTSTMDALSL
jgi:alpha 1,3-glucosidase